MRDLLAMGTQSPANSEELCDPKCGSNVLIGGGTYLRKIHVSELGGARSLTNDVMTFSETDYDIFNVGSIELVDKVLQLHPNLIPCTLPFSVLVYKLDVPDLRALWNLHRLPDAKHQLKSCLQAKLLEHECCDGCPLTVVFLKPFRQDGVLDIEDDEISGHCKMFLSSQLPASCASPFSPDQLLQLVRIRRNVESATLSICEDEVVIGNIDLEFIVSFFSSTGLRSLAQAHGIKTLRRQNKTVLIQLILNHLCVHSCPNLFYIVKAHSMTDFKWEPYVAPASSPFPPPPQTMNDIANIMSGYCKDLSPQIIEEEGCAVCGQLCKRADMHPLADVNAHLHFLIDPPSTRMERLTSSSLITCLPGPVLANGLDKICTSCKKCLVGGSRPRLALANGLWLGEIPDVLKGLTVAEQSLITRVRQSRCIVRVSNGHAKMIANVIAFEQPTLKIYNKLPITRQELDEVLAVLFTGPQPPSEEDLSRTPVLVRRARVLQALEWLKRNNIHYADLEIDYAAMDTYPLAGVPVEVVYRSTGKDDGNILPSMKSQFENDDERGTESGPCPFTVHGLTSDNHSKMTATQRKTAGLQHLKRGGSMLAVGHAEDPESIFGDVDHLYPKMFPWIFPYGVGGLGQARHKNLLNKEKHVQWWLNYYDKRFQEDANLLIVLLNHQLIRQSSAKSFIMVKRRDFEHIAKTIQEINPVDLHSIAERLEAGGGARTSPLTPAEQKCYRLLDQIEYVGSNVGGSMSKKKYMRNEAWSLVNFKSTPTWFITVTPSDNKHPLCLYWASHDIEFRPEIKGYAEREHIVTRNPVACAKFFDYMVKLFIKHVCGWGESGPEMGVFGKPSAYYGTVEQQGRMTLHLHFLLWIDGSLPLQIVRDRLMAEDSEFTQALLSYLESCQVGEFQTGTMEEIQTRTMVSGSPVNSGDVDVHDVFTKSAISTGSTDTESLSKTPYVDPTLTLPDPPPVQACLTNGICGSCNACDEFQSWCHRFWVTTDDIMYRSNTHRCYAKRDASSRKSRKTQKNLPRQHPTGKGCVNDKGECTARFPRTIYETSSVDVETGHVNLRKREEWINNVTPVITATNRCNTDTTCLLSGTAVKATLGYVTDYITKGTLRTHQLFSLMYDTYTKNSNILNCEGEPTNSARKMIVKMVNALSAKSEIGAPYAALILLGNADHYTSHEYVCFYWKGFVNFVQLQWKQLLENAEDGGIAPMETSCNIDGALNPHNLDDEIDYTNAEENENVTLSSKQGRFVAKSSTDDYRFRPVELSEVCLYEWIQCVVRRNISSSRTNNSHLSYFRYVAEHPMVDQQLVACDPLRRGFMVPNFIGPPLPRRDVGDVEEYCCAMLTFFCPWRTGIDLKSASVTWKEAFDAYPFTNRQRELMDNFNIKYECYDARDDFKTANSSPAKDLDEDIDSGPMELDDDGNWVSTTTEQPLDDLEEQMDLHLDEDGPLNKMLETSNKNAMTALLSAGWEYTDCDVNAKLELPTIPPQHRDSLAWEAYIKKESVRIWKSKFSTLDILPHSGSTRPVPGTIRQMRRNDAWVVPASYLSSSYTPVEGDPSKLMDDVVHKFTLNEEQNRAFRIIANHAAAPYSEQLLMHLGGMGGTGKSCVIHSLVHFFHERREPYRFVLLGPTGTSAALIGGSTYHSFLGLGRSCRSKSSKLQSLEELRERLRGVDYILLDEMSMVSCDHLAQISSRLSAATQRPEAFGGLNVILAGDFAQLPPVGGKPLYTRKVSTLRSARSGLPQESDALGKHYWLQFTCVVILKKNMRQQGNSEKERAFQRALENLRFKACTNDDFNLLSSRVPEFNPTLSLNNEPWKNVSIITARNCDKDLFNDVHAERFANEIGQQLHMFYSEDSLVTSTLKGNRVSYGAKPLSRGEQEGLWRQPPDTSEQVPACLKLCLGMPVMLRYNQATDLCITRGQEGYVVGWTSRPIKGHINRNKLEVLFVQLVNPPKPVKVDKLPDNVVPITCSKQVIDARLPSDRKLHISRGQVPVLPNFGMTDYASQGKGRKINVVDIARSLTFQGIYTALSRGLSLDGTLIIRKFDKSQISGVLDGALRQEFRDLNYLDLITKMWFEGELPSHIIGETRQDTINNYRVWRSLDEERDWHPVLQGDDEHEVFEGVTRKRKIDELNAKLVKESSTTSHVKDGMKPMNRRIQNAVINSSGMPLTDSSPSSPRPKKRRLTHHVISPLVPIAMENGTSHKTDVWKPCGPKWDSSNWSCAYDVWTYLMASLMHENPSKTCSYASYSIPMEVMVNAITSKAVGSSPDCGLTGAREIWRAFMGTSYPGQYPSGEVGTDIMALTCHLMGYPDVRKDTLIVSLQHRCNRWRVRVN
ncbi:hypothetical protein CVT24_012186 [Panaeolus cyanescens]|uniref:ATP-dependent DNA helicase n=1 Tax=Panaeolus cyanescens TaxID=181874 RepID=A0A409W4F3_9AGAR|nr:hypothetical protein CVT24_012186 [Panaeolus cyanescens]